MTEETAITEATEAVAKYTNHALCHLDPLRGRMCWKTFGGNCICRETAIRSINAYDYERKSARAIMDRIMRPGIMERAGMAFAGAAMPIVKLIDRAWGVLRRPNSV